MRVKSDIEWLDREFQAQALLRNIERDLCHMSNAFDAVGQSGTADRVGGIADAVGEALRLLREAQGLRTREISQGISESIGGTLKAILDVAGQREPAP